MDLERQKNFYDEKRYFQGKDNPGDAHPDTRMTTPVPRGQLLFGVLFFGFIALLFVLRVRSAADELKPDAPPAAAAPAAAAPAAR